eukprot:CAMPEP_0206221802 /NCGR_PEP_ID=MMETSP0047_2-20121206/5617_1 /ASSEMBLY_ACC=CAM_ASM_000192 /TAXON_ID=195065 /ORGANISM="Chroomonas mesostigmatica_cf, Strain CCMP1168" /LENGTH=317 /DNA_ID=CAMNT_0053644577 /DNA_START=142 /DNA_END=1092 /DNA_ORIENTATION=+
MNHSHSTDTAAFAALLNELRGPLTGVAATLSKSSAGGSGGTKSFGEDDLHKLNFRELADRFEHLSQVLPDALRCVQEVKQIQQSVSERLDILEGRQQSEEAYLASLQELQEAVLSQSVTLQDDIKDRIGQLRQVLNDRESYLLSKVQEVERDKMSVIERQREQCLSVLENMRAASRRAHQALADEDPTTWLDQGRGIEDMLTEQNAVRVEYGPSPDLRFGCTLTVDLQRRILEVVDFDENKGPGGTSPSKSGMLPYRSPYTSAAGLNQSGGSINDMVLPDGTDYATFRRSLLAEGVDATALYRNSMAGGRAPPGASR